MLIQSLLLYLRFCVLNMLAYTVVTETIYKSHATFIVCNNTPSTNSSYQSQCNPFTKSLKLMLSISFCFLVGDIIL